MSRTSTYASKYKKIYQILCAGFFALLMEVYLLKDVNAQQTGLFGTGSASGSATANTTKNLLEWVIDYMLVIGASLSTLFALAVIFLVKFGWMDKSKIKDFFWLILAMIVVPILIPALFSLAQGGSGLGGIGG